MSFVLNPENTVAFCDYCKYLGFDFSIDDENRKLYETPNLCELYKGFGPVSWVVVNYLKTNISRSQVESAFGIAVHCGTRREYENIFMITQMMTRLLRIVLMVICNILAIQY